MAAVADPGTGVAVYDTNSGGWTVFGGTSASAPLVAAMYALAKNPAGVVNGGSAPYAHTANLYDVTLGKNGNCGTYLCTDPITGSSVDSVLWQRTSLIQRRA